MNFKTKTLRLTSAAGLLLCSALAASAAGNSVVTFSVDLTGPIQNNAFTPGTSKVYARGMFNDWSTGAYFDHSGSSQLTNNPSALNTNIYSGTFADTNSSNGAVMQYKYYIDTGDNWESVNNRTWGLPNASGGSLVLPTYYFNDAVPTNQTQVTNSIKFQVDMTQQIALGNFIPGTSEAFARGSFNNWGNSPQSPFPLTNNPAAVNTNLYTGVFLGVTGTEGGEIDNYGSPQHFKYAIGTTDAGYETPSVQSVDGSGNRVYNLLQANGALVLPAVYFNDQAPIPPVTNVITFQVDMSVQAAVGKFDPFSGDYVEARGSFQGWTGGFTLTNRPAPETNVYAGEWTIVNNPNTTIFYKFWDTKFPGNYETPVSAGGGNRSFKLLSTNGTIVLADVLFSDIQLSDVLPADTLVTFSVNMTNAVGTDAHAFNPSADSVYINGDFLGWPTWDVLLPQLTNNPVGSQIYTYERTFPGGSFLPLTYKYSINGTDNEAGFAQNHLRYVRSGGNYVLPLDKFGAQLSEPANGNMGVGAASGGQVPVSWLGTPGIFLQTATNLTSPINWATVPGTAGLGPPNGFVSTNGFVSLTNFPVGPNPTYFRWVKPGTQPTP